MSCCTGVVAQNGRDVVLNTGDFTGIDSARSWALDFADDFQQLVIHLPRELVSNAIGPPERVVPQLCAAESSLGSVVSPLLRHATRGPQLSSEEVTLRT